MEERIKAVENVEDASGIQLPQSDPLPTVVTLPMSRPTILSRLGWTLFVLIGIGGAYVTIRAMPEVPEWVFWPIFVGILIIELVVYAWVFGTSLRLESRELLHGPIWARRRVPFSEIIAVQLLHVRRIAGRKSKSQGELYEINIVVDPSRRIPFATQTNKDKARNIADSLSDIVKAPVTEQLFLEESSGTP